jgi:hypothetical protein
MKTKEFVLIISGIFLALIAFHAIADPRLVGRGEDGTIITLYDEPCALKDQVANLPLRATWDKGKEHFEGCWQLSQFGDVLFYFSDKSVVGIPKQFFKPVGAA